MEYKFQNQVESLDNIAEVIYMRYIGKQEVFAVSTKNAIKSGLLKSIMENDKSVINNAEKAIEVSISTYFGFKCAMQYLDFYEKNGMPEFTIKPPIQADVDINKILEDEAILYKEVISTDIPKRFVLLSEIILTAEYLEMSIYSDKLAAIMAYYMSQEEIVEYADEIEKLLEKI